MDYGGIMVQLMELMDYGGIMVQLMRLNSASSDGVCVPFTVVMETYLLMRLNSVSSDGVCVPFTVVMETYLLMRLNSVSSDGVCVPFTVVMETYLLMRLNSVSSDGVCVPFRSQLRSRPMRGVRCASSRRPRRASWTIFVDQMSVRVNCRMQCVCVILSFVSFCLSQLIVALKLHQ